MNKLLPKKKHHYLLVYLILLLPFLFGIAYLIGFNKQAFAAVIIGNQTSSNGTSSWQHTVGPESNRVLVVGTNGNASSVTYNGRGLTRAVNSGNVVSLWYLANPPTGTANIIVNGSGTIYAGAVTYHNVDLSSPTGTTGSSGGTAPGPDYCTGSTGNANWTIGTTGNGPLAPAWIGSPMSPTATNEIARGKKVNVLVDGTGAFSLKIE